MDTSDGTPDTTTAPEHCAFCGAPEDPQHQLIAGPTNVCICAECVVFAYNMLEASGGLPAQADAAAGTRSPWSEETTGVHTITVIKGE